MRDPKSALGGSTPSAITGTDPLLIVGNGTSTTRSNAFEVFNNGTSVVHHDNGTGEIYSQVIGGTHKDNIIYAWGVVEDNEIKHIIGVTDSVEDFGVLSFAHTAAGTYVIQLNLVDPDTYAATTLQYGAVTAISYDVAVGCAIFKTSEITTVAGSVRAIAGFPRRNFNGKMVKKDGSTNQPLSS